VQTAVGSFLGPAPSNSRSPKTIDWNGSSKRVTPYYSRHTQLRAFSPPQPPSTPPMPHLSDLRFTFITAADVEFDVVEFTLDEALSQPYVLQVSLTSAEPAVDFAALLDQPATFTLWRGGQPVRHVHGIITGFEQGDTGFRRTRYRAVVEPALSRTGLCSDWRIFQQQSVPEILAQIVLTQ